jgi:hypothetical protein
LQDFSLCERMFAGMVVGVLRAGACAGHVPRLFFESEKQESRNFLWLELRASSFAMRWLRLVFSYGFARICAEGCALDHARCGGCDWFLKQEGF